MCQDSLLALCKSTLNYWMMVERYPNFKEEVGGSIPGCEISSLHDIILPCGQLPHVLWRSLVGLMSLYIYNLLAETCSKLDELALTSVVWEITHS